MKLKLSGVGITGMSGTLGDDVISRNQYGPYARKKGSYPNHLPWLSSWQANVDALNSYWQMSMNDALRSAWIEAAGYKRDALAVRVSLRGFQLFMRTNLNRILLGAGITATPPKLFTIPVMNGLAVSLVVPAFDVSWSIPTFQVGWAVAIYASPCISTGRMSPVQSYTFMAWQTIGSGITNIYTPYINHYGAITSGKRIWLKVYLMHQTSGQRANPHFISVLT